MKTVQEMIEIMEAYTKGAIIEFKHDSIPNWEDINQPSWDWGKCDYRIKKQKEEVLIEKWLVKDTNSNIRFVVESENIDGWIASVDNCKKVKIIDRYVVEI